MDKNGLLEILALHRTGKALDEAVEKDKDYQEAFDKLEELNLTADQRRVVDQVITANNYTDAVYGVVAYLCGMKDGIRLRMEMEEIIRFP